MTDKTPPNLDELVSRILRDLPRSLLDLKQDSEKNLRAALHSALKKMDLVTREEFEVQQGVLARTRARLEALEKQVAVLEKELLQQELGTRD
jgi:BMFP domain-containing protein YqiC